MLWQFLNHFQLSIILFLGLISQSLFLVELLRQFVPLLLLLGQELPHLIQFGLRRAIQLLSGHSFELGHELIIWSV